MNKTRRLVENQNLEDVFLYMFPNVLIFMTYVFLLN